MTSADTYAINRGTAGWPGFIVAALVALAMAAVATDTAMLDSLSGSMGLCAPSPNRWHLPPLLSASLGYILLALTALGIIAINKRFSIIRSTGIVYSTLFLLMSAANPWIISRPGSASIIAAVNVVCIYILFSTYGQRGAPQGIFTIFATLSWLSMIQYAALLIMPLYMLGMIFVKEFRTRTVIAMLLGIATPWWIMLGLGVITPSDIHAVTMSNFFNGFTAPDDLFWILVQAGAAAFLFAMLALYNTVNKASTGHRMRAYTSFINLLGAAMIWYIIFDATNLFAYTSTLYLCAALQTATFFTLGRVRQGFFLVFLIAAVYIATFILIIA